MTPAQWRALEDEERALADLSERGVLFRDFGGWWMAPPGPPHQHHGPHTGATIQRLVQKGVVVVSGNRCIPYPGRWP